VEGRFLVGLIDVIGIPIG